MSVDGRHPHGYLVELLKEYGFCSSGSGNSNRLHPNEFCSSQNWRYVISEVETFCAGFEVIWRQHPQCGSGGPLWARERDHWTFSLYSREFEPGATIMESSDPFDAPVRPHFWRNYANIDREVFKESSRILYGRMDHLAAQWHVSRPTFDTRFLEGLLVGADGFAESRMPFQIPI